MLKILFLELWVTFKDGEAIATEAKTANIMIPFIFVTQLNSESQLHKKTLSYFCLFSIKTSYLGFANFIIKFKIKVQKDHSK